MTLREEFEKQNPNHEVLSFNEHGFYGTMEYVEWLESQIPIREQQAWDAAREIYSGNVLQYPKL